MMSKAIQVILEVGEGDRPSIMVAHCIGERSIQLKCTELPLKQPAHALAKLMCQRNKWPDELVYGLLPNGDEVFCFRANGREVNQK